MILSRHLKYIILIIAFLLASEAVASRKQPEREELLFMDIPAVITATKTAQLLSEVPATVIVITKRQIRERGYNNLLDLMKYLPGVDVQDRSAQENYNLLSIRGIPHQEKFIVMMDGHRISSPTGEIIPIAENFPLYNAKQVEIVFGPASALYGADAFAGMVNIITADAETVNGPQVTLAVGNFGYRSGTLYYGDRLSDKVKLSVGGYWHSADNANLPQYL